jgi:hypothetical protein
LVSVQSSRVGHKQLLDRFLRQAAACQNRKGGLSCLICLLLFQFGGKGTLAASPSFVSRADTNSDSDKVISKINGKTVAG